MSVSQGTSAAPARGRCCLLLATCVTLGATSRDACERDSRASGECARPLETQPHVVQRVRAWGSVAPVPLVPLAGAHGARGGVTCFLCPAALLAAPACAFRLSRGPLCEVLAGCVFCTSCFFKLSSLSLADLEMLFVNFRVEPFTGPQSSGRPPPPPLAAAFSLSSRRLRMNRNVSVLAEPQRASLHGQGSGGSGGAHLPQAWGSGGSWVFT